MSDEEIVSKGDGSEVGLVEPKDFVSPEPFVFENGEIIPELTLRYETYGQLNKNRSGRDHEN